MVQRTGVALLVVGGVFESESLVDMYEFAWEGREGKVDIVMADMSFEGVDSSLSLLMAPYDAGVSDDPRERVDLFPTVVESLLAFLVSWLTIVIGKAEVLFVPGGVRGFFPTTCVLSVDSLMVCTLPLMRDSMADGSVVLLSLLTCRSSGDSG